MLKARSSSYASCTDGKTDKSLSLVAFVLRWPRAADSSGYDLANYTVESKVRLVRSLHGAGSGLSQFENQLQPQILNCCRVCLHWTGRAFCGKTVINSEVTNSTRASSPFFVATNIVIPSKKKKKQNWDFLPQVAFAASNLPHILQM